MKRLLASAIALSTLGAVPAVASEVLIEQCVIRKVEKLGISPDLAYTSCQRASIVDCIKSLRGSVSTITAVKKVDAGYFYDLGSDKKLWQEGAFWKTRGCTVIKKGPRITKNAPDKNGLLQRYRWFRQGICKTDTIQGIEYTDQLAFQKCDPGGYIIDSRRNETDKSIIDNLLMGE